MSCLHKFSQLNSTISTKIVIPEFPHSLLSDSQGGSNVTLTQQNFHIVKMTGSCTTNLKKSARENAKLKLIPVTNSSTSINSFLDTAHSLNDIHS